MTQTNMLFFEDKPLFGLDIGHGKVRVVQLHTTASSHTPRVIGYGETTFDDSAMKDGVIEKPEVIAAATQELFRHHLIGDITTRRVAMSLPIARAYTRSMEVPSLDAKELAEAVQTEASQYIPASLDELYLDYAQVKRGTSTNTVFIVAMPRRIVDSYVTLARVLGLEPVMLQTSSGAGAYLFGHDPQSDIPSLLVDFGSDSADITVYDGGPVVSGTVACGSDLFTSAIARALGTSDKEAMLVKAKYGLGHSKKQAQIEKALDPTLALLIKEIRRTVRYYEEHGHEKQKIAQVIIAGGGANMPGLAEWLTSSLRLAVRSFDPTPYIDFDHLQPFNLTERMSYVTATGLAIIRPEEVFA
ncbi:MAG TPA: type IV pilus assembly protein PilM [Verrucomicrobiae bacterium]|nr:type IV pilus assembly protein PilM [Verrucomicrobiae bacterium]